MKYVIGIYILVSLVMIYFIISKINYDFMNIKYTKENYISDTIEQEWKRNDSITVIIAATPELKSEHNWSQMIIDNNWENMKFLGIICGYIILSIGVNIYIYKAKKKIGRIHNNILYIIFV
jgi:hypothetical protein